MGHPRDHAAYKTPNLKEPGKISEDRERSSKEGGSKTAIMSDTDVNIPPNEIVCNITLLEDLLGTETATVLAKLGIGEAPGPGSN